MKYDRDSLQVRGASGLQNQQRQIQDTSRWKQGETDASLNAILHKLINGMRLTPAEISYLRTRDEALHKRAVEITQARRELERRLSGCASQAEARGVIAAATQPGIVTRDGRQATAAGDGRLGDGWLYLALMNEWKLFTEDYRRLPPAPEDRNKERRA